MTDPNPDIVEQTMRIAARPETVWRYWTDPARMREWWGAAELDARPGGVYRVEMDGGPVMLGEYLELVPYERVVFSFGWEPTEGAPDIAPGSTRVEVTLLADGTDTIMTLRHLGLPGNVTELHRTGWEHVLARLADAPREPGTQPSTRPTT